MREMKDSGIEWIGEIPNDWSVSRIKYIADIFGRIGFRGYTKADLVDEGEGAISLSPSNINDMDMSYEKCSYISWKKYYESPEIMVKEGDVIFVKTGSSFGKSSFVSDLPMKSTINPQLIIFKNIKINSKLFAYYIATKYIRAMSDLVVVGGTIPTMSQEKIKNFPVLIPPNVSQSLIAKFLNDFSLNIDATAEDIQKEISLLEDYKKSVITEAVTKGLNPDAEMKDSGIEWIGQIPKHWEVDKIKYHLKRNEPKNPGNAIVLSVYRDYGVIPKDSRDDNHNVTSEDTSKYKYVKKGQLVINKMKAWQGSLAVSDYDGIVSPAYFIYDFIDEEYNHKYFHYLVRSCYKEEFKRISGGIREGQWDLSPEEFSNTLVLLPSVEEQNEILDYILQKEMEIDTLIADKKRQLDILADYKKSLIYEYVTGKKEVPVNE